VKDNEDRAFRLLGLKWVGAPEDEIRKAADELMAGQKKDGGWAQLPGMATDAYATGSALFALSQGGGLPVDSPAYQSGVKFLLRHQAEDGTWFVNKRAMPANNYFDAEYPYGQSQYISFIAGCWSTMALILASK
jgi:squalene cyclase